MLLRTSFDPELNFIPFHYNSCNVFFLAEYASVGYMAKRIQMRKNRFLALQKMAEQKKNEALNAATNAALNDGGPEHPGMPKQTVSGGRRKKIFADTKYFPPFPPQNCCPTCTATVLRSVSTEFQEVANATFRPSLIVGIGNWISGFPNCVP